jgi:hypothetical protein
MAFDLTTAKPMSTGANFDANTAKPVDDPRPSIAGAADVLAGGITDLGRSSLGGLGGMVIGRDTEQAANIMGIADKSLPKWQVGEQGQEFNQWLGNFLSSAYQDYVPDHLKPYAEQAIKEIQAVPEELFTRQMDVSSRLRDKGFETMADVSDEGAALSAAAAETLPTLLEFMPAIKGPAIAGRVSAKGQRAVSPRKREIAKQLERGAIEGDVIPAGASESREIIPVGAEPSGPDAVVLDDPWETGRPQVADDDLGLSGYTTTTAPYKLNKYGKVIDNPKHKIAKDAGFSNSILGFTERLNKDTRARANKMINSRERLYEMPESSTKNDPAIITGESLSERLKIVKGVNREAGQNIDKYVNQTLAGIELNTLPLMDKVAGDWAKKGVNLDTTTWEIDYGDMELNKKGQAVINELLEDMKDIQTTPTGRTVHNLKRALDDEIAYGKKTTGLDAKTQGLLSSFRKSTKKFLEDQFPEYGRANAQYSKTVDVINRIQKGAGKVDLDGEFTSSNLGRMARAIMSQRISRDEIATAIKDLDSIAVENGYKLKDDLPQLVFLANQMDEIWGPSRATGFAGQSKQGAAAALADTAIDGGFSGGVAVTENARKLLQKKQMDDKKKFKAMRELLK